MTKRYTAFTIVEMIVVIVVIAILASIVIVSYNSVTQDAKKTSMEADLNNAVKDLATYRKENGEYPTDASQLDASSGNTFTYKTTGSTYCLEIKSDTLAGTTYYVSDSSNVQTGTCLAFVSDGVAIQTITAANCPTGRVRAYDVRDNHTYWVKKMSDGKCWMLTNLAYAGGGTNTYGDVKTLSNGTSGSSSYTVGYYYVIPSTTNYTTEPTNPSTSTDGTGQYGYLYNFCAANGVQTTTTSCKNSTSGTASDTSISICPSGWRLPSIDAAEVQALYTAVNGGSTTDDTGLRTIWLGMRGGAWYGSFDTSAYGDYWSSSILSAPNGRDWYFSATNGGYAGNDVKQYGFAVRCIAN